jgi:uncharacterized damage-inducible protein DinB
MTDDSGTQNGIRYGLMDPAPRGDERTALLGFLQRQRELVAWKVTGAPDDVLRRVSSPSGMTLPGIVRHLENVERSWFRDRFAGEQGLSFDWTDEDPDGEWKVPADVPMAQVLADYAAEAARCDEVIANASLDDLSVKKDFSLRWIVLHLIEETARHLGQLDLLRENADGAVGEEPEADPV